MSQTEIFSECVKKHYKNINQGQLKIVPIKTTGDIEQSARLDKLGGKGLFAKEIEIQIMEGYIDVGVHSMKDMPAELDGNFDIACWLNRSDSRDVLLTKSGTNLKDLKSGSVIGTSSIRRRSQILNVRNDLKIRALRGNVETRIQKLQQDNFDGIILSYAGLIRLGLDDLSKYVLPLQQFLPAACQGAIGVEIKKTNTLVKSFLEPIKD